MVGLWGAWCWKVGKDIFGETIKKQIETEIGSIPLPVTKVIWNDVESPPPLHIYISFLSPIS